MYRAIGRRLHVSREVDSAIRQGMPIVALETTVLSHGLPPGSGLAVAERMMKVVRQAGAVPAFIGLIDGKILVGIDPSHLPMWIHRSSEVVKCGIGDVAAVLHSKGIGATTVATTAMFAAQAGIAVVATGGIGGVHRQVGHSWDISSDLVELARNRIAVVCSGPKVILDLPKTREYLETMGVAVYGWRTEAFPGFYICDTGLRVDARFDDFESLSSAIGLHFEVVDRSAVLVVNPVPQSHALDARIVNQWVEEAERHASLKGIQGKDLTPFILEYIHRRSEGKTVSANIALLLDNAAVAARLAVAYRKVQLTSRGGR